VCDALVHRTNQYRVALHTLRWSVHFSSLLQDGPNGRPSENDVNVVLFDARCVCGGRQQLLYYSHCVSTARKIHLASSIAIQYEHVHDEVGTFVDAELPNIQQRTKQYSQIDPSLKLLV